MRISSIIIFCILFISDIVVAQNASVSCGQKELTEKFFSENPAARLFHSKVEAELNNYNQKLKSGLIKRQKTNAIVTLPVVVHIIHNNGTENIADAQALTAIQHLNDAFANSGYYDPSDGVNTQIQFCIAKRDPNGNITTGITRTQSILTNVDSWNSFSQDLTLKNLIRWNPLCYINIWLVNDIAGPVAGYAYLPSAHGSNVDGIVLEANYFGSSYANDVVLIHEMGHYLGLYHTFEGSCKNDNCTTDGDKVCDTPPDQSTAGVGCNSTANSCSTDALSGFATDVNDLTQDYMDYGNFNCMKVFTQGQSDRMNWFITNVRSSLLNCQSCLDPCPLGTVASFTSSGAIIDLGLPITLTNTSVNANQFEWYVNGQLKSTSINFSFTPPNLGSYSIKLIARNTSSSLCQKEYTQDFQVICTAYAGFVPTDSTINIGSTLNFTHLSTSADLYRWYVDGVFKSSSPNYTSLFDQLGFHTVRLEVKNMLDSNCSTYDSHIFEVKCLNTAKFNAGGSSFPAGTLVNFTNLSTGADQYEWYINNTLQSSAMAFSYSFPTIGTYNIKLVSKNSANPNCVAEYTQQITIICPAIPLFSPAGITVTNPTTVNFTNLSVNADMFEWYVDNILQATTTNFTYTFTTNGVHKVKLVAGSSINSSCTKTFEDNIGVNCTIRADFSPLFGWASITTPLSITNISMGANQYEWYVDNILVSTATDFTYLFSQERNYPIKLIARNTITGCVDSISSNITGTCFDTADFSISGIPVLYNTINFSNTSTGSSYYLWSVNGLPASNAKDFSYYFGSPGTYEITLTATGACARTKTVRYQIFLPELPDSCFKFTHFIEVFPSLVPNRYPHRPSDFITLPDGGNLFTGFEMDDSGGTPGPYHIKTDRKGNLLWRKNLVGMPPNNPSNILAGTNAKLLNTKDRNYYSIYSFQQPVTDASNTLFYIQKNDLDGNQIWQKSFEILEESRSSVFGYDHAYIKDAIVTPANEIIIIYEKPLQNWNPLFSKLYLLKTDANGNPLWVDSIKTNNLYQFINGITLINDTIVACLASVNNDAQQGYLLKFKITNGQLISAHSFGSDDGSVKIAFEKPIYSNGKLFISGKIGYGANGVMEPARFEFNSDNTTINKILKIGYYQWECITPVAICLASDGKTGMLTCEPNPSQPKDHIFQLADNDSLKWAYLVTNFAKDAILKPHQMLKTADNGWVTWDGYTGTYDKFLNDGKKINCTNYPRNIIITPLTAVNSVLFSPLITSVPFILQPSNLLRNSSFFSLSSSDCKDSMSTCSTPPTPDTCRSITFQKKIGSTENDIATDIKVTSFGEYLISGSINNSSVTNNNYDALLIKLNRYGNKLWQKTIGGADTDIFTKLLILKDGNYLSWGISKSLHSKNGTLLLIKTDTAGSILWQKEYYLQAQSLTELINISGAIELPDGSIAFCGNAKGINTDVGQPLETMYNIIGRVDITGNMIWIKRLRYYYWESGYSMPGLIATGNALIAILGDGVLKVSQADGSLIGLQRQYQNAGLFSSIEKNGSRVILYSPIHRIELDTNLNLLAGTRYNSAIPGSNFTMLGTSSENGSVMQGVITENLIIAGTYITRYSTSGETTGTYKLPFTKAGQQAMTGSRITNDNGIFLANLTQEDYFASNNANGDIYVVRTDSLVKIPDCPRSSFHTFSSQLQPPLAELTIRFYPLTNTTYATTLQPQNASIPIENLCAGNCSVLQISGQDTICNFSDTVIFRAQRNQGCNALTDWYIDSSFANIISVTDSTISLQFKKSGSVFLYGTINTSCKIIVDSFPVTIITSPDSLKLGPDIQLCKISTYTIKAGKGFKSYQWQDGSTDSTLTIYTPGTYHVAAEDYCGKILRDTIVVSQSPDIPFDLGADLTKCNTDTLTITAPAGFVKYYWSPNYKMNNSYLPSIRVAPDKDTMYTVIAEKSPGCLVTDSIRIIVNKSAAVNLGNDTSFCMKDSITITAANGFSNYIWNTGANTQSIHASTMGKYSVAATDSNGCISRDTLQILTVYPLPAISLGNDFSICSNTIHQFDAGNFASYLWQDGSANKTFSASQTGTYWVRVKNSNGCTNSDTTTIISYLESPSGFLDDQAEICLNQRLELKAAGGYNKYRWFNNSGAAAVTVTAPGDYWLEVTNTEGCTARDTILVKAKDCIKGIFFPNAFTPGNGGNNNLFRPIVYGGLESFYMAVYNRWGQKIFETRDFNKGWDGTINGLVQDTNTFTWTAIYKFVGSTEKTQYNKGTITLIR